MVSFSLMKAGLGIFYLGLVLSLGFAVGGRAETPSRGKYIAPPKPAAKPAATPDPSPGAAADCDEAHKNSDSCRIPSSDPHAGHDHGPTDPIKAVLPKVPSTPSKSATPETPVKKNK